MIVCTALAGCTDDDGNGGADFEDWDMMSLAVASPVVEPRDDAGTTVWDADLELRKVHNMGGDEHPPWSGLRMVIKDWNGSVMLPMTALDEWNDTPGSGLGVWFQDVNGDGLIDVGDHVRVTGMDRTFQGALVELVGGGNSLVSASLPTHFED